jgi:hypothetical protein
VARAQGCIACGFASQCEDTHRLRLGEADHNRARPVRRRDQQSRTNGVPIASHETNGSGTPILEFDQARPPESIAV